MLVSLCYPPGASVVDAVEQNFVDGIDLWQRYRLEDTRLPWLSIRLINSLSLQMIVTLLGTHNLVLDNKARVDGHIACMIGQPVNASVNGAMGTPKARVSHPSTSSIRMLVALLSLDQLRASFGCTATMIQSWSKDLFRWLARSGR